jgi:hypothetical protein
MPPETPKQKEIVGRVMHEFKHGELKSAGGKVRNPRQAVAIGLSEAGVSNRETPEQNKRNLRRTVRNERRPGGPTRVDLYAEATKRNVKGRARMTKDELRKALGR